MRKRLLKVIYYSLIVIAVLILIILLGQTTIFKKTFPQLSPFIPDFAPYRNDCKYQNCQHINEPECAVLEALKGDKIPDSRYESYLRIRETIVQLKDSKI